MGRDAGARVALSTRHVPALEGGAAEKRDLRSGVHGSAHPARRRSAGTATSCLGARADDADPHLKATPESVQWGWLDPKEPPKLTIESGDPDAPSPRKGGATDPMSPVSTIRPWKNGSNMDINELTAGSTLFVPVFLKA